jgi:LysR family transcriptional regulator, cyn operon transcriptional activator
MKLIQLKYFLAAAKHEHINKAAKEVFVTPSTVSHSLSQLEKELNQDLFKKQGKTIRLTESGKCLVKYAEQLLAQAEEIKLSMSNHEPVPRGCYRIAATHGFSEHWVVPTWTTLLNEYEHVTGEFFSMRSHDVVQAICLGQIDIGFCISPHDHPMCQQEVVFEDFLAIALRQQHPFLAQQPYDLAQLSHYPMAVPKSYQHIKNCERHPMLDHFNIRSPIKMVFDSYNVAEKIIETSNMWGILPHSYLNWSSAKLATLSCEHHSMAVSLTAVWARGHTLPLILEKLKNRLKSSAIAVP